MCNSTVSEGEDDASDGACASMAMEPILDAQRELGQAEGSNQERRGKETTSTRDRPEEAPNLRSRDPPEGQGG